MHPEVDRTVAADRTYPAESVTGGETSRIRQSQAAARYACAMRTDEGQDARNEMDRGTQTRVRRAVGGAGWRSIDSGQPYSRGNQRRHQSRRRQATTSSPHNLA